MVTGESINVKPQGNTKWLMLRSSVIKTSDALGASLMKSLSFLSSFSTPTNPFEILFK